MPTLAQRIEFKERIHRDRRLSRADALIALRLFELSQKRGFAFPSVEELMERDGIEARRTVQRSTDKLSRENYFTIKPGGGKHERNQYRPVYLSLDAALAKLKEYGIVIEKDTVRRTTSAKHKPPRQREKT